MLTAIKPGRYIIRNSTSDGAALAVGPVPLIYPPMDVPLRHFGGALVRPWSVGDADQNGLYTIVDGPGRPNDYALIAKDDAVFVSAMGKPQEWSIEPAADGKFRIALPDGRVAALNDGDMPQIKLAARADTPDQLWEFIAIEMD